MRISHTIKYFSSITILCSLIIGCHNSNKKSSNNYQPVFVADSLTKKTLTLGYPNFSYSQTAELLVKYLNANLQDVQVKIKACVSWEEYLRYIKEKKFDITFVNGIVAFQAAGNGGYSILAKVSGDEEYKSVIFARKDARIKKVTDLKGKRIAFLSTNLIPGIMMGTYYLHMHGVNVNHDIQNVTGSSFESLIIATYLGNSDAGICSKRNWIVYTRDHPEVLSKVELKWETPPVTNNAVLVNDKIDRKIISELVGILLSMNTTKEGKMALDRIQYDGFEKADINTYKSLMEFKKKYDAVIF